MGWRYGLSIWLVLGGGLVCGTADAELVRFEIRERTHIGDEQSFAGRGPYERIRGRVFYEWNPALPQNAVMVDLHRSPRNARGRVESWAELDVLTPANPQRASGTILYDVNNRGNKVALRMFNNNGGNNPQSVEDLGDGFLMRSGMTVVWSGWDGELLPGGDRLRLAAPKATGDGGPITGLVRCEIVVDRPTKRSDVNWANHGSYRPTAKGLETATLTVRERPGDPRTPVPREAWTLHVSDVSSDVPTQLPRIELELPEGYRPGFIYELIYEAQDPLVMGAGFAAVRDLIAALKHGTGADNPFLQDGQPYLKRALGFGVSQSGRFLREFLGSGFNADEAGQTVLDGLMPHVAGGGLGSFNHRFAQPTRHGSQHDHHDYPPDRFPFAYDEQVDPFTAEKAGLLQRALATGTVPKIMHTQSSAEYWTRAGSLPHTTADGMADAPVPEQARFYSFGGTQHGPSGYPPGKGAAQNLANPGDYRPFLRALLLALERWVAEGTSPPPSIYPRMDQGTLVGWDQPSTGFPPLPGVTYPAVIHAPWGLDRGPLWATERIIDLQPPRVLGEYRVLVPKSDADGNDVGCLLPPEVAVPIATFTGWNLRNAEAGAAGELMSLTGSYLPFPLTAAERMASGDPRRSIQERYSTLDDYEGRLQAECQRLVAAGYLLPEDAERLPALWRSRLAELWK